MSHPSPYIVTLSLDEQATTFFNGLRQQYFPPAINYLKAHLTLFHHLPSTEQKIIDDVSAWSKQQNIIALNVVDVVSIGKGVAYKIESAALKALHNKMRKEWKPWLTLQDAQGIWPHITVQNKVTKEVAAQTLQTLRANFKPFDAQATGFHLFTYENGPWKFVQAFAFTA